MCGVYGIVDTKRTSDTGVGRERTLRLGHRGPDHVGEFEDGPVYLGHTRLSILDPAAAAHQPFGDEHHVLAFNGEIYNYRQLAREHLAGVELRTSSDTEVLFELLRRQGGACLSELNGMFAFAFFDRARRSVLLARDRTGIKPLYYVHRPSFFEFASEIRCLTCEPDASALHEVIRRGRFEEGTLPWREVHELPAGHALTLDIAADRIESRAFARLTDAIGRDRHRAASATPEDQLAAELDRLLQESVALHLQSDAPVGSLCSGGIDSSLVSALAIRQNREVRLYHAGVEGAGGEESYAEQVSRHIDAPIVYTKMTKEEYWRVFPWATLHNDLPVYHPNDVPLYSIAGRARADGVKVLLTGEGADEMFGGYAWHRRFAERLARYRGSDAGHGLVRRAADRIRRRLFFRDGLWGFDAEDFVNYAGLGAATAEPSVEMVFRGDALATQEFRAWGRWMDCLAAYRDVAPAQDAPVLSYILNNMYGHLGTILHRTDRILMAHSIEGRVPFLENGLFEFALNLPLTSKIRNGGGKALLKRVALRYLPKEVVFREKVGFPVPWVSYLPEHPEILRDGFVAEWTGLGADSLRAWYGRSPTLRFRLIALEVWGRIFVGGQPPAEIVVR